MTSYPARVARGAKQWWALAGFAAVVVVVAAIGALGVGGTSSEYQSLERPSWAPPSQVFGPVWTVVYGMIALSGWLAWRRAGFGPALLAYAVQLALNASWTPLFFGAGRYGLALVDIAVLWVMIGVTVVLFWRVSRPAALVLLPYWAWVTYATALNASIWHLN